MSVNIGVSGILLANRNENNAQRRRTNCENCRIDASITIGTVSCVMVFTNMAKA